MIFSWPNNNRRVSKAPTYLAYFICKLFYDCLECFSFNQTYNDVMRSRPDSPIVRFSVDSYDDRV